MNVKPLESREVRFVSTHALVFHEAQSERTDYSGRSFGAVITSHPIQQTQDGPVIGAGCVLSLTDQHRLQSLLDKNMAAQFTLLPENVLAIGNSRLLWFIPGRVRPMFLRIAGASRKILVPWPTLLAYVDEGSLMLAALISSARPDANTPLYHAPIANTDGRCVVCTGRAVLPDDAGVEHMDGWEDVVFNTYFSHTNQTHTLRLPTHSESAVVTDEDHVRFWTSLANTKATVFPAEALVPFGATLGEWI